MTFLRTCLDETLLPTAEEMNTGKGAKMEKREVKLAKTGAYLSRYQIEYSDPVVRGWLISPKNVEMEIFSKRCGENIPENYISRFEDLLYLIHEEALRVFGDGTQGPSQCNLAYLGDIIYIDVFARIEKKTLEKKIILKEVYLRPCAEGFAFFRIFLNELLRNCLFFDATFVVKKPVVRTKEVLDRAFGDELITNSKSQRCEISTAGIRTRIAKIGSQDMFGVAQYIKPADRKRAPATLRRSSRLSKKGSAFSGSTQSQAALSSADWRLSQAEERAFSDQAETEARVLSDQSEARALSLQIKARALSDQSEARPLSLKSEARALSNQSKARALSDQSKARALSDQSEEGALSQSTALRTTSGTQTSSRRRGSAFI